MELLDTILLIVLKLLGTGFLIFIAGVMMYAFWQLLTYDPRNWR